MRGKGAVMRRRRSWFAVGVSSTAMVAAIVGASWASTPPEHTVAAPAPPGTVTVTWPGTIPAGVQPTSGVTDCSLVPGAQRDDHAIHLQVPDNLYTSAAS